MQLDLSEEEFVVSVSSLLHDIGKVRQRYMKKNTHQFYSHEIVTEMPELASLKEGKINSIISNLVLHHHTREEDLPEDLKNDDEFKKLLEILKFSDWKSAGHDRSDRDPDEVLDLKEQYTVAMEKIFMHLEGWNGNKEYVPMFMLHDSDKMVKFFQDRNSWDAKNTNFDFLKDIDKYFLTEASKIKFRPGFEREYVNKLTSLLMDSTRTVPSAFWYSKAEIPLFDHLKTTAAIANCRLHNKNEFLLISADISGIQEYIFRYVKAENADDRASRRMRGRSFIVRLLSDAVQSLLENRLGLYSFNTIYDGSGGFLIMAPLFEGAEEKLKKIKDDIDHFCYMDFKRLSSVIAWKRVKFDDLVTLEDSADSSELISDIQELREETGRIKSKRAEKIIRDEFEGFFNPTKAGNDICISCGLEKSFKEEKCLWCLREEVLGSELVRNKGRLTIHKKIFDSTYTASGKPEDSLLFSFGDTTVLYVIEDEDNVSEFSEDMSINDSDFKHWPQKDTYSWKFIFLGNNVPIQGDTDARIMTLEEMAKRKTGRDSDSEEIMPLAVVKMDVDNMGKLMAFGFKKLTISRISTLSYFISYFFSVFLNEIAKENFIYVIFSGGDDITAVGQGLYTLKFAIEIREYFRRWAGPTIGLSAGIVTSHHSYPIRRSVDLADENLSRSKSFHDRIRTKDSATLFDNVMSWTSFQSSMKMAEDIYLDIKNGNLGAGFPYLLIDLDRRNPYREGKPSEIMIPDYYLYYYLSRNYKGNNMKKIYENIRKREEFEHIGVTSRVAIMKIRGDR